MARGNVGDVALCQNDAIVPFQGRVDAPSNGYRKLDGSVQYRWLCLSMCMYIYRCLFFFFRCMRLIFKCVALLFSMAKEAQCTVLNQQYLRVISCVVRNFGTTSLIWLKFGINKCFCSSLMMSIFSRKAI